MGRDKVQSKQTSSNFIISEIKTYFIEVVAPAEREARIDSKSLGESCHNLLEKQTT